jgi:hypothetical protein
MPWDQRDDDLDISIGRRGSGGGGSDIPNYLTQAILVTLFCCWPFGIPAIVSAAKVNTFIAQGDFEQARAASEAAKKWCIVSAIMWLAFGVLMCFVQILLQANRGPRF